MTTSTVVESNGIPAIVSKSFFGYANLQMYPARTVPQFVFIA